MDSESKMLSRAKQARIIMSDKQIRDRERPIIERLKELEHIYATAPIGLCVMDTNLRYLEINQWLADINGVSIEGHIGRTLRDVVPHIADSMEEIYRGVLDSVEPALDVVAIGETPGHPGEVRVYSASYYPLLNEDGDVWRISSIVRDISAQRKAENELREANENLEGRVLERTQRLAESNAQLKIEIAERMRMQQYFWGLIQSAPDAVALVEPEGRIRFANALMESTFGYSGGAMLGLTVEDLMPNPFRNSHIKYREEFVTNPKARPMGSGRDLVALRKNGEKFPVEISLSPVHVDDEMLVLCSVRDITERKRESEEARRIRDELAHVLRLASMDELAESLAHELNQPLTGIVANAQAGIRLLNRESPDIEETSAALQDVASDGKRAGLIIQNLRRLLNGSQSEKDPQDLTDLIHETVQLSHSELIEHGVMTELQLSETLPLVQCNRVQIQQVLLNLVTNAIGALKEVSKRSRVIVISSDQPAQDFVTLSVRDYGSGIRPDMTKTIFDAFVTTKEQGMGMGLSISQTIIQDHGGRLWGENNSDAGATFNFALPIRQDRAR